MAEATILAAARRDLATGVKASLALVALGAVVLGFNWKYVYNFAAGPAPFSAALAAAPGAREFVTAQGTLVPTGWAQDSTVRLLRGLVETKSTTARYLAMVVDGRLLVVKAPVDFAGQTVAGRLVALPAAIQATIPPSYAAYPWMVDATIGYRWDFNLFVPAAALVFVLGVVLFANALWRSGGVERHPMIARLAASGTPLTVVDRLETELRAAPAADRVGPFVVTRSALVAIEPSLIIAPFQDLVGAGVKTTSGKSGDRHSLMLWLRGRRFPESINLELARAQAVVDRISARAPYAVVDDAAAFDRRWAGDRAACERDAAAARRDAAKSPSS